MTQIKLAMFILSYSLFTSGCMRAKVTPPPSQLVDEVPVIEEVSEAEMAEISTTSESSQEEVMQQEEAVQEEEIQAEAISTEGILAALREKILKEIQQAGPEHNTTQPSSLQNNTEFDNILRQFQTGIQLLEDGRTEEGRLAFESLRDLYPDVSVFHINLGIAYKRLNRLSESINAYRHAVRLQGTYPEAYYNLAIILKDLGAFAEAEAAYLKTIALSPDFLDAHYNLAVLYDLYLDQAEAALRHYRRYTELKKETDEEMKIWMAGLEKRITTQSKADRGSNNE